ncbi:hypothetical protein B586_03550 [Mycobacterium haemophilum DSM 44634]|nr:hypothetical protein B586_03550 [Mycobacterium haemophilum DSM 44634]
MRHDAVSYAPVRTHHGCLSDGIGPVMGLLSVNADDLAAAANQSARSLQAGHGARPGSCGV